MFFLDVMIPTYSTQLTSPTIQMAPITASPIDPMVYWGPILLGLVIIAVTFSLIFMKRAAKKPLEPGLADRSRA